MHYVYLLQSINNPEQTYIGCSNNLRKRLSDHNCGNSPHTDKYKPWKILVYLCFDDKDTAVAFEEYLKSGSGRAMVAKRFLKKDIKI